jgi:predicted ATPase/class 3 adenylate cyclase
MIATGSDHARIPMADLPRGTVTFLFTDIEGSTVLWERDAGAMQAAVARHDMLLSEAITAHRGTLFKRVGDAVQAAFPTAPGAVAAALVAQRSLLAEEWGQTGPLRVRMALHAGEAVPDERGDYLAAPLNRLSRLLATGHGGQILLSQAVQQLSRDALPEGVELRDLGEHRLRDLLDPERVFQLLHPDLPADFPPLRSLEHRPHNLPRQPTPFLGREREVGEVVDLLRRDDVQLLTLVGPGGTGKTRLALQAAAELVDGFADGVFFASLATLTDPALVPAAIAAALGIREEGAQPLAERLREFLAAKRLLLVVDNIEHLVEAAPELGRLLETSPHLTLLVTSRVPLRLRAEREYPVPPLSLPRRKPPPSAEQLSQYEAVRLFIDRAQAVKPDFTVDNAAAPAIAEICHRLDGLPLAIELAAARVRMLPPEALLRRLEQRLPLLTGGNRDAPVRQRTLRDAIAWSHDLLEPEEQIPFRRLAVFAGGATLDAAETVANPDGALDAFGALERLVEHSLARQEEGAEGEPRFAMLETIREFGLEQLEASGEAEATRRGHAELFAGLFDRADPLPHGSQQKRWLERLGADLDNFRAALSWAVDGAPDVALRLTAGMFWFWYFRGHLSEGREWIERALDASAADDDASRAMVLSWASALAWNLGDSAAASSRAEEALRLARATDDAGAEAWALLNLGVVAMTLGNLDEGARLNTEALEGFRASNQPWAVPFALSNLGAAAARAGKPVESEESFMQALGEAREAGNRLFASFILVSLGFFRLAHGDHQQAGTMFDEALATSREFGFRRNEARALHGLADVAEATGDPEQAETHLRTGEAIYLDLGDTAALVALMSARGHLLLRQGRVPQAREVFDETLVLARSTLDEDRIQTLERAVAEALTLADESGHESAPG